MECTERRKGIAREETARSPQFHATQVSMVLGRTRGTGRRQVIAGLGCHVEEA